MGSVDKHRSFQEPNLPTLLGNIDILWMPCLIIEHYTPYDASILLLWEGDSDHGGTYVIVTAAVFVFVLHTTFGVERVGTFGFAKCQKLPNSTLRSAASDLQ